MFAERPARGFTNESGIASRASTTAEIGTLMRQSNSGAITAILGPHQIERLPPRPFSRCRVPPASQPAASRHRTHDAEFRRAGHHLVTTPLFQHHEPVTVFRGFLIALAGHRHAQLAVLTALMKTLRTEVSSSDIASTKTTRSVDAAS